jgi:hypothetical protein
MHRSGTSALTRVFNLAGAFLPDKLMPPVAGNNERGFWEPVELVAANERALAAAGVAWDSPRHINPVWFDGEAAEHSVFELVRFLERTYSGVPLLVLKDPRLCRVVPLLRRALQRSQIDETFVLSLRHPSAVAGSLEARDGMPRDHGRALWVRYMLDAEHWTRDAPRIVIGFDELMADWAGMLARVASRCGLSFSDAASIGDAVAQFLAPELVHHRDQDDEKSLPPLIGGVWSALRQLQAGRNTQQVQSRLDRAWNVLSIADDVLGAAFSWEMRLRQRTEQRARAAERARDALQSELTTLRGELLARSEQQADELQELRQVLDQQSAALATLSEQQKQLGERDESIRGLTRELESLRDARREANRLQARQAERIGRLEALLRNRDESVQSLRVQLETLRTQYAGYQLQSQKTREELQLAVKRVNERIKFLQSMAMAALEQARRGDERAA